MLYKGLMGAASIPINDLVPRSRRTRNHPSLGISKPHWLGLTFTSPVSSPRLLEIGIPWKIHLFLLLRMQRIQLLSLLLL